MPTDEQPEIMIGPDGNVSGLNSSPAAGDTAGADEWESPDVTNPPAADSTSTSPDAGGDDTDGGSQAGDVADETVLTDDEDEWADTKPAVKADPDDVPPEDRDPKGKVPSWRVREIREKADREIAARDARIAELEAGRGAAKPEAAATPAAPATDLRAQVAARVAETDPVVKECDDKLTAIAHLVEHSPEELVKYFRNADHMASEVARLTAIRETRVNAAVTKAETDAANEQSQSKAAQEQYVSKLATDYETAIKTSKIPNVDKYAQRIAANASKLNIGIRHLILSTEDKDVVTAAIGSNRKLFDELASIDTAKPMNAMQLAAVALKLGKAVAKYQAPVRETVVDEPTPQPQRTVQATATRRATHSSSGVPKYKVDRDGTIML